MPATFTLISSVTVGSGGAANIEFTSIPATYTDLQVLTSFRASDSGTWQSALVTFNSATTNFGVRRLYAYGGSTTGSDSYSGGSNMTGHFATYNSATANVFSNGSIYIPNYTGSTNKSMSSDSVTENNAADNILGLTAGLWSNTAAITSIKFVPYTGNFMQYSTAYLYGISNA